MKGLFQLLIILVVSLLGELLAALIPLPIPASIYGMLLMLLALMLRIIPLERVRGIGKLLLELMPVMFIPAAVGLLVNYGELKHMLLPCLIALFPVTLIVMGTSGIVTQAVIKRKLKAARRTREDTQ